MPPKTGIVVPDWDALRLDAAGFAWFTALLRDIAGQGGLLILSLAPTAAATTILRDDFPLSFVAGPDMLSVARLARLCDRVVVYNGGLIAQPVHARSHAQPRIGLVVSNGFGLGHVARMQAIANGLKDFAPIGYMSYSGAMGKGAFHLPSPRYLDLSDIDARIYGHEASLRFFNAFAPTHIVYDGNVLPSGLLSALAMQPDIHLTWVRRGQWQKDVAAKYMAPQALCDLVIEPGDLADAYDTGPTWTQRLDYCPPRAFLKTKPIRALHEMLDREPALRALGLNPDGRYILLMPGASPDIAIIRQCVAIIVKTGKTPVLAHWPIAHEAPPVIRGAIVIERMPLVPYYQGFDAIVSAAGYNSFHEILASGVPAVFVPQEDAGRDQQLARARYAADKGLAVLCRSSDLDTLLQKLGSLKTRALYIDWHDDWAGVAQAMDVSGAADGGIVEFPQGQGNARAFEALHQRWLEKNRPFAIGFVLALDITTQDFLQKRVDPKAVIVTNSIDPMVLRRAGFQYLWLNAMTDFASMRQFWNWLRVWRPARVKPL